MCRHTDIEINSSDRISSSPSSTNFRVALPHSFSNIKKASSVSLSIPNVFYNISSSLGNTVINWSHGASNYTANIPAGCYSATDLATQIQDLMNAQDANSYSVIFSMTSFLTAISGTAAFKMNFSQTPALAAMLGFNSVDTGTNTLLVGSKAWNLALPYTFYLNIPNSASLPAPPVMANLRSWCPATRMGVT